MKGYIYSYKNILTNERFIGQTLRSIEERSGEEGKGHLKQPKFGKAIKEYGWDNFECEILEVVENDNLTQLNEKLNELEKFYIKKFDSCEKGYNCTKGGKNCLRPSNLNVIKEDNKSIIKIEENVNNVDKKIIGACISGEMYRKLKAEADENFISISDVVRKIIYLYIKNNEKNC